MAVNIELKRSSVPGKIPASGSLNLGELAINTADGAIYFVQQSGSAGNVLRVATTTASGSTAVPTASYANYSTTSSLALNSIITASAVNTTITFFKGDGTNFNVTVSQSGSVASASYASFAQNAASASYSQQAQTASYVLNAVSSSYALTASYVSGSSNNSISSSYAITSSYSVSASFASVSNISNTASYVLNAISSSYALTASSAVSASFASTANTANTASYVLNAISSSYASTSSYANNFTVGGTLTAQTIVVQTITSSIDYSSGSNIFGNNLSNTQTFTGSINATGSFTLRGNEIISGSSTATGGYTGSLFGTASSAVSSSYSVSSSQAQNANTASNVLGGNTNYIPYWATNTSLGQGLIYQTGSTVVINQTGYTSANPEALYVWQPSSTSFNVISGKGNLNNYLQLNIQNLNNGNTVSSDIVATANNGDENNYYVDLGINGQYYNGNIGAGPGFANDGYLYNTGNNFYIGNYTSGSSTSALYLFNGYQGDHNPSFQIANNLNVYISSSLVVTGSITGLRGFTGSLQGSASYATTSSYASYSVTSTSASYSSTASYWSGSILNATSASYSNTSSYASTASYVQNAISSSYSTSPISITGSSIYSNTLTSGVNPNNAVALGYSAGNNSVDSTAIVTLGYYAGSSLSNSSNAVFIGNQAGFQAINSNNSYYLGNYTGYRANNSYYSIFIGDSAGYLSNNVQQSIFLGINSGYKTYNSFYSNFIGYQAGYQVTSSYSNLIGYQAGYNVGNLSIGNNNIIIGTNVTLSSSYSNGINIGGILFGSGTYSTTTGNPFSGSVGGKIGINQPNPQYTLDVSGSGNFTNGITGSLFGTASYSNQSLSSSYALTASYVSGSSSNSISSSYAITSSLATNNIITASAVNTTITFTKGDGTTFNITISQSGSVASASYATFAQNATSASYSSTASYAPNYTLLNTFNLFSSSYSTGSFTGSFIGSHLGNLTGTASYATTASYSLNTQLLNNTASSVFATTGSNTFIGNQILTGSLYQSGTLYQTGNQILTGSLFTTGSNTLVGNTTLTGSLNVSGSTTQIGNNNLYGTTTLSGSIIISGSQGTLPPTVQIYGDTTHNGVIQFLPVTAPINTSISASYIYVSGSTQDLYFSQNGAGYANTTRLRWIEGNLYTGLLNGGNITTQSSTVYQVSSGSGIIVNLNASTGSNPYPIIQYLNWPNLSQSIAPLSASYDQQFIAIQASGSVASIYAQGTPYYDGQYDTLIPVGLVLHQNRSTINTIKTQPSVAYGWKQRSNVFIKAFGPLKLSGFSLSPSGSSTGSLVVGAGTAYDDGANYPVDPNNPSYVSTDQGTTVSKIWRYYQSGSGWVYNTNGGAGYTTIDPTQYSNNGVLTAVPGGGANRQWSIQRCYWFPNSATKAIIVYYGNATYIDQPTAYAALNTEAFTEAPNTAANAIYLGALLVQNNANFTNSSTYAIIPSGLFRSIGGTNGGSGTIAATTLASLSDVNITEGSGIDQYALMWNNATTKWIASNNLGVSITGNAATATSASYATTSSYVLNAVSSSYATTASYWSGSILNSTSASYASTASYVTTAQTASYYGGSVTSASYAATSSYANNFTVAGTLTAQTIVVQTITSSNDYITGSSINGSLLTNTHQFTGSVTITGSLAVNGSNTILTNQTSSMSVLSSSYALTASYYGGSVISASYASTASYVLNAISSSYSSNSTSASYATTSSYVITAQTASYYGGSVISASYASTASYVITAQTASYYGGSVTSASYASTASYVLNAISSSYSSNSTSASYASTASYVLQAVSASFATLAQTANTASYVVTAQTASYWSGSILNATSASYASTASYVVTAQTASYYGGSVTSASYASTASYVQNAVSSSYATNATTAQTSSYANATPVTGFTIGGSQIYYASVSSPGNVNSNIFSTNTGSFTSAFYNYTVSSGSNARAGQVIAVWTTNNSSSTEFSTIDIGSTSAVTASIAIVTGQIQFNMQTPAGTWIIKSTATYL